MRSVRILPFLACAALVACATTEEPKPAPAPAPAPAAQSAPAPVAQPAQRSGPAAAPVVKAEAPAQRSVYFDFDRSDIRPEYRPLLEAHARYLRDNPAVRLRIEGNCDERGSREYNVALGQRRAEAMLKTLVLLGVDAKRVEPVSFGEEKPRCTTNDEGCWAQNRRGDFAY